jgi:hypothetical protein
MPLEEVIGHIHAGEFKPNCAVGERDFMLTSRSTFNPLQFSSIFYFGTDTLPRKTNHTTWISALAYTGASISAAGRVIQA